MLNGCLICCFCRDDAITFELFVYMGQFAAAMLMSFTFWVAKFTRTVSWMRQALFQWMQTCGTQSNDQNFPSEYRFRKRSLNRPAENWWISCCDSPHFLMLLQVTARVVWILTNYMGIYSYNDQWKGIYIWFGLQISIPILKKRTASSLLFCVCWTFPKWTVQDYKILAEKHNFPKGKYFVSSYSSKYPIIASQ